MKECSSHINKLRKLSKSEKFFNRVNKIPLKIEGYFIFELLHEFDDGFKYLRVRDGDIGKYLTV